MRIKPQVGDIVLYVSKFPSTDSVTIGVVVKLRDTDPPSVWGRFAVNGQCYTDFQWAPSEQLEIIGSVESFGICTDDVMKKL